MPSVLPGLSEKGGAAYRMRVWKFIWGDAETGVAGEKFVAVVVAATEERARELATQYAVKDGTVATWLRRATVQIYEVDQEAVTCWVEC